jgi:hypothetical protein
MKAQRLLFVLLLALAPGSAQELLPAPVPVPEGPSESDFDALRKTSPFTRVLSLPETYALRGVATIGDSRVVTLYNRETKQTLVVTPEGDGESGLSLVEIVRSPQLDGVAARISFAGDEAELKYEAAQLNPEPSGGPGGPGGSGGSSRPGEEGERRGPSPQDIERFRSLPEEKQAKMREYIGSVMRNYPNLSREERGNLIRGAMVRLMDGRDIEIPQAPPQGQGQSPGQGPPPAGGPPVQTQGAPPGVSIQVRPSEGSGDRSRSGGDRSDRSRSGGDRGSSGRDRR